MEMKFVRPALMVGNHKMNLTPVQTAKLAMDISAGVFEKRIDTRKMVRMGVAVSPACLGMMMEIKPNIGATNLLIGAQGFYAEAGKTKGAFTNETSIEQLADLRYGVPADFSLLGHSETRDIPGYGVKGLGLTDKMINERLLAALTHLTTSQNAKFLGDFFVILCVGETLEQNEAGQTIEVLKRQIETDLDQVTTSNMESGRVAIAYEPVWAIGTGKTASVQQANDACAFSRSLIKSNFGAEAADKLIVQYGGSMSPKNVKELMSQPDIDGGLVGGASLKVEDFLSLLTQTYEVYNA